MRPRNEVITALKLRLDQIAEWPDEILRSHPTLDRLQMCQSVDAGVLFAATRLIAGSPAAPAFAWLVDRLQRYSNHTVLNVSGFELQGLLKALNELPDAAPGKVADHG